MTNTIEVPISLIKAGDMDAIRELLPKPDLFGRWATHPEYGSGFICSTYPDFNGFVRFAYKSKSLSDGANWAWISPDDLTLDPVELTTVEDFENAPEGTIVADSFVNAYQKGYVDCWVSANDEFTDKEMKNCGPWKVLRWGWGE